MLRSRHRAVVLAVLLLALALPSGASANALVDVVKNIQANILAHKGTGIDACAITAKKLSEAYGEIPIDEQQYAPDLGRAIQAALRARAAGACDKKAAPAQTTTTPAAAAPPVTTTPAPPSGPSSAGTGATSAQTTTTPEPPPIPASLRARTPVPVAALRVSRSQAGTPAALIALAATATALGLLGLAALAVRRLGLDPRWTRPMRHAFSEAGWRTGGTWEDFTDWLRLGR